jgi:hypothetical protein
MKTWQTLLRFVSRFRHQVSLPEEVAMALGIHLSNFLSVPELLQRLCCPTCSPTRLMRLMHRHDAEAAFLQALRVERFSRHTLCSYYFKDGWLEFVLQFDEQQQLRRVYMHHKHLPAERGVELSLKGQPKRAL